MDWKQFVANMAGSLAWPLVALIFILMFRAELGKIVQRLAHLKYKDIELDFEKVRQQAVEIHKAEEKVPVTMVNPTITSLEEQVANAIETAPSAAILLAWSGLEVALASAVSRVAITTEQPSYRSPIHNVDILQKQGHLSKKHVNLINQLRAIRNKIAHEMNAVSSITQEHAQSYATAAMDMAHYLERVKGGK